MKIRKSVTLVNENLKINMSNIKNIVKLETIIQENIEVLRIICSLKYSVSKKFLIVSHNGSIIIILS